MNDATKNATTKVLVTVLAVIGGITVLGLTGMALMHTGMLGGGFC